MRKPLIAGNWKMNLNHLEAIAVTQKLSYSLDDKDYDAVDVVVLPPFTDIRSVQTLIDGDRLRLTYGAQDLSPEASGAFTGDISGSMLNKLGCSYVAVGHSERRAIHNEGDEIVNRKIKAALANEITPIFCVGEELIIREAGTHVEHVINQISKRLYLLTNQSGQSEPERLQAQKMRKKFAPQFVSSWQRSVPSRLPRPLGFSTAVRSSHPISSKS
jgi:triosephosphate isomerase